MTQHTGSTRHRRRTWRCTAVLAAGLVAAGAACSAPAGRSSPAHLGPSSAPGGPRAFTLVASGDVLPHTSVIEQAHAAAGGKGYDFAPMLSGVKPVVSEADLAICHMETVYGADGDYTGYPTFKSPPEIARGLRATGYDACSTASNHTLDDGAAGIDRTLGALDQAGIRHAGSARTAAEDRSPGRLQAGGAKVAHLAYTYDTNGFPLPEGRPWAVDMMEPQKILADARAARKAGADVVVVSLHWGTEWQDEPDEDQLDLGQQLTASRTGGRPDIDLILGTHAHVPQAYQKVNGTWVIYGMGDQIAGDMFNNEGAKDARGNQSSIGRFTFAPPARPGGRWQVRKAEFVPQWFDVRAGRVVDVNRAIERGENLTGVRDRIRQVVLSRGAAEDGLTMAE
ncbi:CapA family protein [Streptomyces sp. NPDC046821]|uniref:CapA family protein n=1 Tax=Streptomyces sp. NPDC046821 TaxID=3154702 RepID=UPI0033F98EF3